VLPTAPDLAENGLITIQVAWPVERAEVSSYHHW